MQASNLFDLAFFCNLNILLPNFYASTTIINDQWILINFVRQRILHQLVCLFLIFDRVIVDPFVILMHGKVISVKCRFSWALSTYKNNELLDILLGYFLEALNQFLLFLCCVYWVFSCFLLGFDFCFDLGLLGGTFTCCW